MKPKKTIPPQTQEILPQNEEGAPKRFLIKPQVHPKKITVKNGPLL